MLEVDDVAIAYDGRVVVDGVSLGAGRGEVVCLLGASGSGKTSLLRAIAGLERPTRGAVRWDGRDLTHLPAHERGVGFVFQDFALFPHRDVGENVAFGARMRGRPARVAEMLELVGLPGYERRATSTLSGGETQRVALARALASGTELLLLDEPLGSLDRLLRERLTLELRSMLTSLAIAVVHVTHDQHEALAIADRVVLLRDGRVAQAGTPTEVWSHPADEDVARFLGFRNIVPVDGASVRVLPAESLSLGIDGEPGTVRSVTFTGSGFAATVDLVDGTALEVPVSTDAVPAVGAQVRVAIDPRRTILVPAVPSA
jgi:thiamine transport system ATP-binding protein